MGFVPVNLGIADSSALKANLGNPFKFSPFSGAILPAKTHNIPDPSAYSYRFDILNLAYYLKIHAKSSVNTHLLVCPCKFIGAIIRKTTPIVKID